MIEIKHKLTDAVIYKSESSTTRRALEEANEQGVSLEYSKIVGKKLECAELFDCDLRNSSMCECNLNGANLSDSNLSFSSLVGANLSGADLSDSNLYGANLWAANLSDAILLGANIIDAGVESRGYHFRATYKKDFSAVSIRAGCRHWSSFERARLFYTGSYDGEGVVNECVAKIDYLELIFNQRKAQVVQS